MNYATAIVQMPLVMEGKGARVQTPGEAAQLCADISGFAQETFHVLALNTKNRLIERQMITVGIVDASLAHAREVFRGAIQCNASGILLVHNHPSGDPAPSAEDIRITRQLIEAGKIIDIKVLDHVIIGRPSHGLTDDGGDSSGQSFISMRESGLCKFA